MEIRINEDEIRAIVKEESDRAIRRRIREMQGEYTSKGYLEQMMREILWETLSEKIPNLELFVYDCVKKAIDQQKQYIKVPSKSDVIDAMIEALKDSDYD